ncbi:MAG: acyloxyacyl hydrolase [Desulfuromonas sp.]|nr:acyloxyacyl hydrolase [Desulfuromonas sp.]
MCFQGPLSLLLLCFILCSTPACANETNVEQTRQSALTITVANSYAPGNDIRFVQIGLSLLWDYDQVWPHRAPEPLLFKVETAVGVASTPHCRAIVSANMLAHYTLERWGNNHFQPYFQPYVEAGIGLIYADFQLEKQGLRINFNPLLGIGTEIYSDTGQHWFVGARLHHVSNAELHDDNHGINSLVLQLGHFF